MLASTLVATLVFIQINSKEIGYNLNYNGPFNHKNRAPQRRLVDSGTSSQDVSFYHGIASGAPTDVDLLIWTRVTPPFQNEYGLDMNMSTSKLNELKSQYETIIVSWAIALSESELTFECSEGCGTISTTDSIDYTVKHLAIDLAANTWYYYQFKVGETKSQIGKTRTLPASEQSVDNIRFAFGSCKQFAWGYFNNLRDIAAKDELDYMVFLGDYIYEFPTTSVVNGTSIGRIPFPDNYLYNLSHYRGRYLQHHLDEDVQVAHQTLPWIMVFDDHEVVNNYWFDGAPERYQNDALFGVDFMQRKINAYKAFFEWNPVRSVDIGTRGGLYNSYSFGDLLDLIVIDAQSQRTKPAESVAIGQNLSADVHYAFGATQREWIVNELQESTAKWRIMGTDNTFGTSAPNVFESDVFGPGNLEGYAQERLMILDAINSHNINNVVSVAGGAHTGMAQKIFSTGMPMKDTDLSFPLFTEFVLDAIAAPNLGEETKFLPYLEEYNRSWSWVSPYFRLLTDGYLIMDVNKDRVKVEFWVNNNTKSPSTLSVLDATMCVYDDSVEFDECDMTEEEPKDDNWTDGSGMIIGVVIGVFFIVALMGICVFVIVRKRRKYSGLENQSGTDMKALDSDLEQLYEN